MSVVDYDRRGSIGVLRLNAPPVNAITFAVLEDLRSALRRANADAHVRGVVIIGDARHFSAGADVNLFREITGAADAVRISRVFQEAFQEVEDSGKPVVAAMAGHVTGGALELAIACHFRVCSSDSRFSAPEVKLGINPGAGGTQRLPRLIGTGPALKMLLTGEAISADEALAAGLVDVVCEGKELVEKAAALLESHRPLACPFGVGSAGDPPAPPGDPPGGTGDASLCNKNPESSPGTRIVPSGGSPDGTGGSPVLPTPDGCPLARTRDRVGKVRNAIENDAAFAQAEKILAGVRPEIIAPSQIVDAVRAGMSESFEAGLRKEQEGFAACMETLATRNKIYLFFATRETARAPVVAADVPPASEGGVPPPGYGGTNFSSIHRSRAQSPPGGTPGSLAGGTPAATGQPARVTKAGVVGMGSMGTGIVHALIIAGMPVVALDQSEAVVQKGLNQIRSSIESRVAQGKCARARADQMLALIRTTTNWQELTDADLVIEAVFEDVPAKRAVIASIEKICRADAIIASNTSTISLDDLAEGMKHPERLVGIHFFNPAHRMPLVEVIHRKLTPPGVTATAIGFAKTIRKTPVLVRNREGFVVNRMFIPYVKEAFWLLEEGADARAIDRTMVEFGFPMGPFVLMDMAGLDILAMTDRVMSRAFPRHGLLPSIAAKLVEGGHLGQKSGSGVYRYEKGDRHPQDSEATGQIISDARAERGITAREMAGDEITERLVLRMVHEAFCLMAEGVAQRQSDVDAATVLGLGFPDFRGGVLKYAHDLGLTTVQARIEKLAERLGERFSAGELRRN